MKSPLAGLSKHMGLLVLAAGGLESLSGDETGGNSTESGGRDGWVKTLRGHPSMESQVEKEPLGSPSQMMAGLSSLSLLLAWGTRFEYTMVHVL
jgi:hypothetical protein